MRYTSLRIMKHPSAVTLYFIFFMAEATTRLDGFNSVKS